MKKNISKIYTIVVLIVLILLGVWSTWDIYQLRASNSEAAMINIQKIKTLIEKSHNSGIPFNDNEFFKVIRSLFSENPELEILTIYSHDADVGIEYHYNKGEEIQLLNLSESNPLGMKDLPEYKYNQLIKTKLSSSINSTVQTGLDLDLIYQVIDRKVVYNILIRVLIVVVVLFFTTLFMIFTISRKKEHELDTSEDDRFDDSNTTEDEMSLDWDENGFDTDSENDQDQSPPAFGDLSLDDNDFGDLSDDVSDDFGDIKLDDVSDDFGDITLDEVSDDFGDITLDEVSDDFGDITLDEESDDFSDLNLNDTDDFSDLSDDFSDIPSDTDSDLDNMSFDDSEDDFGDLKTDIESEDFDELSLDDVSDDFSDLSSDSNTNELDSLGLDDEKDDFADLTLDSDIPEEEDLLAMDHEISPSGEIDDFDFDDMDDSLLDEASDDAPSLYSPKSGVGWEDFIEERVNLELERAAAGDQDLVMGIIQCENLTEDNYSIFADQLKEDFNYPDMIFEYKEKGFALIVPSSDLDDALRTLEMFTGKEQDEYGEINVGISSRNGRLITGSRIFMEAENALHKAIEDNEKNIVGFRSDPDKFREFLSNK